jgi:hypothetical protein
MSDYFCSTFYDAKDFTGKSLTLCNYTSNIEAEWRLSDNGMNDKITSIKAGIAIACILCAQHTYFRGKRLWLIGGDSPSKRNLATQPFPGGGSWNNRIASCLTATVSPTQVLSYAPASLTPATPSVKMGRVLRTRAA